MFELSYCIDELVENSHSQSYSSDSSRFISPINSVCNISMTFVNFWSATILLRRLQETEMPFLQYLKLPKNVFA